MKKVHYSRAVKEKIEKYYEDYVVFSTFSDMQQRAFNISRIRKCLTFIEDFLDNTYVKNGRNFISIENIAEVEYIESNTSILVKDIYFKNEKSL